MDFHTGEGGWSGKFCFGSGQVGRKNPGDGLPHQGGRVVGEVLFWVRAGWPENTEMMVLAENHQNSRPGSQVEIIEKLDMWRNRHRHLSPHATQNNSHPSDDFDISSPAHLQAHG